MKELCVTKIIFSIIIIIIIIIITLLLLIPRSVLDDWFLIPLRGVGGVEGRHCVSFRTTWLPDHDSPLGYTRNYMQLIMNTKPVVAYYQPNTTITQ
jgi:hypothetical protein